MLADDEDPVNQGSQAAMRRTDEMADNQPAQDGPHVPVTNTHGLKSITPVPIPVPLQRQATPQKDIVMSDAPTDRAAV